jgi:hypothetical protein
MLVVGDKEKDLKELSVRERGVKDQYKMPDKKFLESMEFVKPQLLISLPSKKQLNTCNLLPVSSGWSN